MRKSSAFETGFKYGMTKVGYVIPGGVLGGAMGAIGGASVDPDHRWRGAARGALVGSAIGATGGAIKSYAKKALKKPGGKTRKIMLELTDLLGDMTIFPDTVIGGALYSAYKQPGKHNAVQK